MIKVLFFITCSLFLFSACSKPAPGLSADQKILLDSLFLQQVELINPELDSLCEDERQKTFRSLVDSIAAQRIDEIYQIIN